MSGLLLHDSYAEFCLFEVAVFVITLDFVEFFKFCSILTLLFEALVLYIVRFGNLG